MDQKHVPSPVELVEKTWRGPVLGVIKISAKAGFFAALALAGLVGLIVYGISTAGHRHANANGGTNLTKASEQHAPWWDAVPNAQPTVLKLPPIQVPSHIAPLLKSAQNSVRVPPLTPISTAATSALDAAREAQERRRALLEAAEAAPVTVRLNGETGPALAVAAQPAPSPESTELAAPGTTGNASQTPEQQNQKPRDAFLGSAANAVRDRFFAVRQDDPSPYELHAGSIIPAVLLTGINAA
ncbi:MAG TPA: hypothetical protein VMT89_05235, partial [Candidatus Acidoferrales bacterium]|nr:hypothetical protein [Candidatus Acidoferrales bacterium]